MKKKNILKNKTKSYLMNQLKINKKSLELLELFRKDKSGDKYNSKSSRNNILNKKLINKNYTFNSNIDSKKKFSIRLVKNRSSFNSEKSISNLKSNQNFLKPQSKTDRVQKNLFKTIYKDKLILKVEIL